jgi:hypothetical protein
MQSFQAGRALLALQYQGSLDEPEQLQRHRAIDPATLAGLCRLA